MSSSTPPIDRSMLELLKRPIESLTPLELERRAILEKWRQDDPTVFAQFVLGIQPVDK